MFLECLFKNLFGESFAVSLVTIPPLFDVLDAGLELLLMLFFDALSSLLNYREFLPSPIPVCSSAIT